MTASPFPGHSPRPTDLSVDMADGRLEACGRRVRFDPSDPDGVLLAYLRLVRTLRGVQREPSFVLRRGEVLELAEVMRWDAVDVLDHLGELMGASITERRTMVTSFAAGALLIAVATGAAALTPADAPAPAVASVTAEASEPAPEAEDQTAPTVARSARQAAPASEPAPASGPTATSGPAAAGTPARVTSPAAAGRPAAQAPTARPGPVAPTSPTTPSSPADPAREGTDAPAVLQPGADIDLPSDEDEVEIIQPGATIDLPPDDDVEIVQPGATIDLPPEDVDAGEDGPAPADPVPAG